MTRMRVVFYGSMVLMVVGLLLAAATGPTLSREQDGVMSQGSECPAMKQCPGIRGAESQPTRGNPGDESSPTIDLGLRV
jgi:hypothetical protein